MASDDYIYVVAEVGTRSETFTVTKFEDGTPIPDDVYNVVVKGEFGSGMCSCSCLGFHRQRYNRWEHKHVKVIQDFVRRGKPVGAQYRINGSGRTATIEFIGQMPIE